MPLLSTKPLQKEQKWRLGVSFDRSRKMPCVNLAAPRDDVHGWNNYMTFPFEYGKPVKEKDLCDWLLTATPSEAEKEAVSRSNLVDILGKLITAFYNEKATSISIKVAKKSYIESYAVVDPRCDLDDATLRLSKTPQELEILRIERKLGQEEVEAARDGIVYLKLPGKGSIGTLGK